MAQQPILYNINYIYIYKNIHSISYKILETWHTKRTLTANPLKKIVYRKGFNLIKYL